VTTELLEDEEDRNPEENMDRLDAEDFLLAQLLSVNKVCDGLLDAMAVGTRKGVCFASATSTLGGDADQS
jgi:hypothetical protein